MMNNQDSAINLSLFIKDKFRNLIENEIRNKSIYPSTKRVSHESDINAFAYHHIRNLLPWFGPYQVYNQACFELNGNDVYPDLAILNSIDEKSIIAIEIKWCKSPSFFRCDSKENLFKDIKKLRGLVENKKVSCGILIYGYSNSSLKCKCIKLEEKFAEESKIFLVPLFFDKLRIEDSYKKISQEKHSSPNLDKPERNR